jgi:Tfp pilus assembly protein PilZ
MTMTIDPDALASAILEKMKEEHRVFWIDPERHSDQHAFLALLMQEREERIQRKKRIEEKIAGSLVLSFILMTIGLIGAGALDWMRKHLN